MTYETPRMRGVILVVTRDRDVQSMMTTALSLRGLRVGISRTSQEAIQFSQQQDVRLVFTDLTLPNIDAFQVFQILRSSPTTRLVPFVFLAAREVAERSRESEERVGGSGSQDQWLGIPLSDAELDSTLNDVFSYWELEEAAEPDSATPRSLPTLSLDPDQGAASAGGELSGRIGQFQVGEILQIFERSRRSGMLLLGDSRIQGQIFFVNGEIHHALLDEIDGCDAVFLLLNLREGHFDFFPGREPPARTIMDSSTSLLLEGMRQMDETQSLLSQIVQRRQGR